MFLLSALMILSFFSSRGWESWDVEYRPLIPERMPVLVDDDLRFEDGPAAPRPAVVVNRWLRELPASGAPAPSSWENYARAVKEWMEFLAEHGVGLFDSRERLKAGLSRYAEHRAAGPVTAAVRGDDVGPAHEHPVAVLPVGDRRRDYAAAEPFTYRTARALFAGTGREVRVNLAVRRTPKPHVTIKYLEPDFTELFRKGLRGLAPDGVAGHRVRRAGTGPQRRGRRISRCPPGCGCRSSRYLLPWEIPALPPAPTTCRSRSRCRPGSPRAASSAPRGSPMRRWPGCTITCELDRAATADGSALAAAAALGRAAAGDRTGRPGRAGQRDPPPVGHADPGRAASPGRPGRAARACWRCAAAAGRSPPGPRCSSAPPTGSGPGSSRGSRTCTPTGCVTRFSMRTLEYLVTGHYRQAARLVTRHRRRTLRWCSTCPRPTRCWCCVTCSGIRPC